MCRKAKGRYWVVSGRGNGQGRSLQREAREPVNRPSTHPVVVAQGVVPTSACVLQTQGGGPKVLGTNCRLLMEVVCLLVTSCRHGSGRR